MAHFGVGSANRVMLTIKWPSGQTQVFNNLDVNERLRLLEPGGANDNQPPLVAIQQPLATMVVSEPGILSLEAQALDGTEVSEVRYFVDDELVDQIAERT